MVKVFPWNCTDKQCLLVSLFLATSLVLACVVKADVNSALSDFKVAFNRLKIKVTQSVFTTSGFQNSDKCQVIALL